MADKVQKQVAVSAECPCLKKIVKSGCNGKTIKQKIFN